jgi:hypothetical protein
MGQSLGAYAHAYTPDKARADLAAHIARLDAQIADHDASLAEMRRDLAAVRDRARGESSPRIEVTDAEARILLTRYRTVEAERDAAVAQRAALAEQQNALDADTPPADQSTEPLAAAARILAAAAKQPALSEIDTLLRSEAAPSERRAASSEFSFTLV